MQLDAVWLGSQTKNCKSYREHSRFWTYRVSLAGLGHSMLFIVPLSKGECSKCDKTTASRQHCSTASLQFTYMDDVVAFAR